MDRETKSGERDRSTTRSSAGESDAGISSAGPVAQVHEAVGNQAVQRQTSGGSTGASGGGATGDTRGGATFSERAGGTLSPIEQPSDDTCWAAVTAMMLSWRDGTGYSIETAMQTLDERMGPVTHPVEDDDTLWDIADRYYGDGSKYEKLQRATPWLARGQDHIEPGQTVIVPEFWLTKFESDTGLWRNEYDTLLNLTGMVSEPTGTNVSLAGFRELLADHGPLWVTADSNLQSGQVALHARIVTGIWGDGRPYSTTVRIVDPSTGTSETELFAFFAGTYEEDAGTAAMTNQVQLVHWP